MFEEVDAVDRVGVVKDGEDGRMGRKKVEIKNESKSER